ncbi:class I SAM-dependent methyltransferase [Ameyamaea chiangmaiensis]|uniref:Class I SAM-dependent methyltransferase n=2 Tax=Ameyamaea chiangmaiensis TaxID=442969 RepID=A0A850PB87_9PROT|nr:class I SAM-dependent methyltransferase [Ameyamaea chiangmaiensis]
MARLEARHWWFVGRRAILADVIARHVPGAGDRPLDIVELGAGTGGNQAFLARFGPYTGLEPDPYARSVAGPSVREGALPDAIPFPTASADLVAMFDVLEHLDDDVGSLRAAAGLLRPDGRLVLSVPAFQWLWSDHDRHHHHRRRYGRRQLVDVARRAGLQVTWMSSFNTVLFPLAAGVRLARRLTRASGHDDAMPPPVLNAVLTRLFAGERHILPVVPFPVGLSIVAVLSARPDVALSGHSRVNIR